LTERHGLTRRSFVGGVTATAGVVATRSPAAWAGAAIAPADRPVVIVGAGLAGMTLALDLVEARREVVVLEARDRAGGRVLTHHFDDTMHAELGGESIDDNHHDLLALLDRFGLPTENRPLQKPYDSTVYYEGTREPISTFLLRNGGQTATDYLGFFDSLDTASAGVDPVHPELAPNAAALDAMSLDEFISGLALVPEAEFLVRLEYRGEYNAEAADLSMLFIAQQNNGESPGELGVESMRVQGGNSRLTAALADALGPRIRLSSPVDRISVGADGVSVRSGSTVVEGSHVVLAAPLMALRGVTFDPPLPTAAQELIHGLDLGPAAKVVNEYSARFWTPLSPSGFTLTDLPFHIAWAATDSYASTAGLLSQFITGDGAVTAATLDDGPRVAAFGAQLDEVYPEGALLRTGRSATKAWAREAHTGGGYAIFRPGQMVPFWPVLREGVGRLRFAGEHTEVLIGYMESAVRSGHRVAQEILAGELPSSGPPLSASAPATTLAGRGASLPVTGGSSRHVGASAIAAALALYAARAARRTHR
jgi:monoamine oxidase